MESDSRHEAKALALRLLGMRSHGTEELRKKLLRKGHDAATVATILGELQEKGLLDDRAFAAELIDSRMRRRPAGTMRLKAELRSKGVASGVADELLAGFDTREACRQAAQKKMRLLASAGPEAKRRKLTAFLQGRGFGWSEIREVLDQLLDGTGSGVDE